jgi:hypothetical protein
MENKPNDPNRRVRTILLFLLLFVIFLSLFLYKVKGDMIDFEVNYKAGTRLRVGETLYQVKDGHFMFKYLPSSALLYLPLSFIPLDVAKAFWYFAVIFCLVSIVYISKKMITQKMRNAAYLFVLPPIILSKFFLRELQLGQINAVITMVLLLMIWFMAYGKTEKNSKNEIWMGLLWGLAVALKPYALIFFPYFLLKKKWKALSSALGFLFLSFLATSLFYGFRGNIIVFKDWISTLSKSTPRLLTSQDNISIIALFMKWTDNQALSVFLYGLVIALLAFLVFIVILRGKKIYQSPVLECSILLILIPLISPMGWDYTLLISVLGVMIIIRNFFQFSKFWRIILVANFFIITFSLYDLMGREYYVMFMSWSVITINFLILVGYLACLRFKEIC